MSCELPVAICGWEVSKRGCDLDNAQLFHLEGKVSGNTEYG